MLSLVMCLSLLPMSVFAATGEDDGHICDVPGSYCLVCDVAKKINALPTASEITVDNAAAVTEQIHTIDRIKGNLTDREYNELLTLIEHGDDGSGYGLDVPTRYMQAVTKIRSLTGGGSLYITKAFRSEAGSVVNTQNAVVQLRITGVDDTTYSQDVTLFTLPVQTNILNLGPITGSAEFMSTTLFYSANADANGWTYDIVRYG